MRAEIVMLDSSPEQIAGEIAKLEETRDLRRRRRKRHHAQRQKRMERLWRKALIAFLFVLTIGLVLSIWYALLKT
jgi:hypothetical protein